MSADDTRESITLRLLNPMTADEFDFGAFEKERKALISLTCQQYEQEDGVAAGTTEADTQRYAAVAFDAGVSFGIALTTRKNAAKRLR